MQLNREKIDQFKKDVATLGQYHIKIAEQMGLNKSNFSSYYHGRHSITNNFLKRFYDAWGDELRTIYEKQQVISHEDSHKTVAQEKVGYYPGMNYMDDNIHALRKNNNTLLSMLEQVIEGNVKLVNGNEKLMENNLKLISSIETVVESNQKLIEASLLFLGQQDKKLDLKDNPSIYGTTTEAT